MTLLSNLRLANCFELHLIVLGMGMLLPFLDTNDKFAA